jgi:organic radical activating enzyme
MNNFELNSNNINKIKELNSDVILFGSGFYGKLAYSALKQKGIEIKYFVDENPTQHGKLLYEKKIISLEELKKESKECHIFICSGYVIESINSRLKGLSFKNLYNCVSLFNDLSFDKNKLSFSNVNNYLDSKTITRKIEIYNSGCKVKNTSELNIKYIDIMITEKCSMKCKDCSNLMQYYEDPKNSDTEILLQSVDKIMDSLDSLNEFRVLGGEPFMNKEIGKIIRGLKKYEKVSQIVIYTNGTILPKGENLEELKHSKIVMDITNYGSLSRNHDKLIEVLIKENIPFLTTIPKWTDSGRINFQKKTEDELKFQFKNCCTNDYLTLLNGKLYRCPFSANTMNLKAIPMVEDEFIDLQKNRSTQDLKDNISKLYYSPKYLSACHFCNGRDFTTPRIKTAIQADKVISIPKFPNTIAQ